MKPQPKMTMTVTFTHNGQEEPLKYEGVLSFTLENGRYYLVLAPTPLCKHKTYYSFPVTSVTKVVVEPETGDVP